MLVPATEAVLFSAATFLLAPVSLGHFGDKTVLVFGGGNTVQVTFRSQQGPEVRAFSLCPKPKKKTYDL